MLYVVELLNVIYMSLFLLIILNLTKFVLKKIKYKYYYIFSQLPVALVLYDRKGKLLKTNQKYKELYNIKQIDYNINVFDDLSSKQVAKLKKKEIINIETESFKYENNKKVFFLLSKSITPLVNKRTIIGYIEQIKDITEKRTKEEEMLYLCYHDYLTGIYNKRFFEEELKRLDKKRNLPLTVVMGDVNGLKDINDLVGHEKGDELIKKTANALKKECRADDILARVGGDEFYLLLPKTTEKTALEIISRIQNSLLKKTVADQQISIAFGAKTKTNEKQDINYILKKAEEEMYTDKNGIKK